MIKFFRKIRQKLLMENKTSKYFKYAIGEIILVVIGILIALQINNWNDQKKETKELHQYLSKIKGNIHQDILILDSIKIRRWKIQKICANATQDFLSDQYKLQTFITSLESFVEYYFVPNQSGYDALKNSSYLGKINGTKIDSLLDNYNIVINQIVKEEEGFNTLIENMEYRFVGDNDLSALMQVYFYGIDNVKKNPKYAQIIEKRMKELNSNNAYRAIVTRTASQTVMLRMYDQIIKEGNLVIEEINKITNND